MRIKLLLLMFSLFTLISCKNDDNQSDINVPTGFLKGRVVTPNNLKPVGGAIVFVTDDNHKLFYTYTDVNGNFNLQAPIGTRKLHIQTGGGANFRTHLMVEVVKDQTNEIDSSLLRLEQVARLAYVHGSYDNIEDIITNLGYEIEMITYTDLSNFNIVKQYDIIFLNCGSKGQNSINDFAVYDNLSAFVTNGGSLYASDWDVAYLTGGNRNSTACNMAGGFISDETLCSINNGPSTTVLGAVVVNDGLLNSVGFSSLDIEYDLGSWQRIVSLDTNFWEVLVKNPTNDEPLMIKTSNYFNADQVTNPVGDTADNGWITICHMPENGTGSPITITISEEAWPAHEAHGDVLGSCTNSGTNGIIYFTTFHNHANENIGNSGLILEYVILNL